MSTMKQKIFFIHTYVIQIILNCIPIFLINIFYDNQTYIGYQLHHQLYLILWSLSTIIGLYIYSKIIWEYYQIEYHKMLHSFSCLLMILGAATPYTEMTVLKDLHVWLCILGVLIFLFEWVKNMPIHLNKNSTLFFINIGLSIMFTFMFGHVTSFCEIYFSLTTNILLHHWEYSLR